MANQPPAVHYTVDPSTNPALWPPPAPDTDGVFIYRVDVIFVNVNGESNLRILRTGTNEHVHHVVMQVTKHIARGIYRIVSMTVSEYSCVVVMETEKSMEELRSHGFPWDRESNPQPEVVLR